LFGISFFSFKSESLLITLGAGFESVEKDAPKEETKKEAKDKNGKEEGPKDKKSK